MSELLTLRYMASRIASESCNLLHSMAPQFATVTAPVLDSTRHCACLFAEMKAIYAHALYTEGI
jgi:hypothetical protein